jgi:hypothetical protein
MRRGRRIAADSVHCVCTPKMKCSAPDAPAGYTNKNLISPLTQASCSRGTCHPRCLRGSRRYSPEPRRSVPTFPRPTGQGRIEYSSGGQSCATLESVIATLEEKQPDRWSRDPHVRRRERAPAVDRALVRTRLAGQARARAPRPYHDETRRRCPCARGYICTTIPIRRIRVRRRLSRLVFFPIEIAKSHAQGARN